jgi:TetR/AcrR family transcriptional repressor of nem operon
MLATPCGNPYLAVDRHVDDGRVMSTNAKEAILAAARQTAQAHGYGGLNYRDLATEVGIKAASIHYHFPAKADLGAAVAKRYWEDIVGDLADLKESGRGPADALERYPSLFRRSLENGNRMCLCSFMAAEYDDLPDMVKKEVQTFADVNIAWLRDLFAREGVESDETESKARAIFAAVSGAQLLARSRADIQLFDQMIEAYRKAGLLAL